MNGVYNSGERITSESLAKDANVDASGVYQNVLFWDDTEVATGDTTDAQGINRAVEFARTTAPYAEHFVSSFPNGYETVLDQGGTNVSGGQKQRLTIARALLKKPKILILDDSTSAVDTKTDAYIRRALAEEIPDTTKIIVSQRISSIEDADRIIVLNEGKIDGIGSHEELLASNDIYKEVYESQVKGGTIGE